MIAATQAPAADLVIPKEAIWLPAQGLAFTGPDAVDDTAGGVAKLMALRKSGAGSVRILDLRRHHGSAHPIDWMPAQLG